MASLETAPCSGPAWRWDCCRRMCHGAEQWFMSLEDEKQEDYSTKMRRFSFSLWGQHISVTLWRSGVVFKPTISLTGPGCSLFLFLSVSVIMMKPSDFVLRSCLCSGRLDGKELFLFGLIYLFICKLLLLREASTSDPLGRKPLGGFPFNLVQTAFPRPCDRSGVFWVCVKLKMVWFQNLLYFQK